MKIMKSIDRKIIGSFGSMTRLGSNDCKFHVTYRTDSNMGFVPKHHPPSNMDIKLLSEFLISCQKIFLLTGAGISTESGTPDYRSEGVGLYSRTNHKPMKIQEFMKSPSNRARYWARNFVGWPRLSSLQPNISHWTVKRWEDIGIVKVLATQNVDGLHEKTNMKNMVALHGTSYVVRCLSCRYSIDRNSFQHTLNALNPYLTVDVTGPMMRPDGDIEIPTDIVYSFQVPSCPKCQGVLKPDIVFFGDNVPKARVEQLYNFLERSNGLLVLGSTLQTFSAFRYILHAKEKKIPVCVVNLGPTRADHITHIKISSRIGEILPLVKLD